MTPARSSDPDKFDAEISSRLRIRAEDARNSLNDLRHFFASQLIANGETAAFVRDQMGHSSIQVTFDTYGHLFSARQGSQWALRKGDGKGSRKGRIWCV